MKTRFIEMLKALGITITDEKYEKFIMFYEILVE